MTVNHVSNSPIRIVRLSHMYYRHADLAQAKQFLEDFGMHVAYTENDGKTLYFAGEGPEAYVYIAEQAEKSEYMGGAFLVESKEDLELATKLIPGASKLHAAGPAGGYRVTFQDPDGSPVNLVWGIEETGPNKSSISTPASNHPLDKPRLGTFVRYDKHAPCPVFKLGHFGLLVTEFQRSYDFFTKHFNIIPSDFLTNDAGEKVAAFCRIDRGEEYVDHHSFFFEVNHIRTGTHHCSFEVQDPDVQAIGHHLLAKKGYNQAWGMGRHILGSQMFDYWFTPDDFLLEHYSDSDQVNCHNPPGTLLQCEETIAIYGPSIPKGFGDAIPVISGKGPAA